MFSCSNLLEGGGNSLEDYDSPLPSVVVLGFFDGVHLGHRQLFEHVVGICSGSCHVFDSGETDEQIDWKSCRPLAFTFLDHPSRLLRPDHPVELLCTCRERLRRIRSAGIEWVAAPFDENMARMSPQEFASKILASKLHAKLVVVGDDYRFGYGAAGGVEDLRKFGRSLGFRVDVLPRLSIDLAEWESKRLAVSSSLLRDLVKKGKLDEARQLWGCYYQLDGIIVRGRKVGRTLGIPTANIEISHLLVHPPRGVFAALCQLSRSDNYCGQEANHFNSHNLSDTAAIPALAYWGNRPTFDHGRDILEVCLLTEPDRFGSDELYGWHLEVNFVKMLRGQVHFPNSQAFVNQVELDKRQALTALG
ncbi:MAG: hypothetical protein K6A35_08855 [bacterium]|nr:hypothetical protein [bacterium]